MAKATNKKVTPKKALDLPKLKDPGLKRKLNKGEVEKHVKRIMSNAPTILEHYFNVTGKKAGPVKAMKLLEAYHHSNNAVWEVLLCIYCVGEKLPNKYKNDPDGKFKYMASFRSHILTPQQIKEYAQLPLADLLEMLWGC
jgi:hypothetical protein